MTQANPSRSIREAFDATVANGGGTFDILTLADYDGPQDVWSIGGANGLAAQTVQLRDLSPDLGQSENVARQQFNQGYLEVLRSGAKLLGTWLDDGQIYIDAIDLIADTVEAIDLGYERGEKAIFNLSSKRTLELT